VYGFIHDGHHVRFHLISPADIAPSATVQARLGSQPVAANHIQQFGSLIDITIGDRRGSLIITCGGTTIYAGIIQ
jgi:hypothetical protein